MGKKIMIAVPSVQVFDVKDLENVFSSQKNILSLVSLKVFGDVKGLMLFTLEQPMALSLCEMCHR